MCGLRVISQVPGKDREARVEMGLVACMSVQKIDSVMTQVGEVRSREFTRFLVGSQQRAVRAAIEAAFNNVGESLISVAQRK